LPHRAELREIFPPSLVDSDSVLAVKLVTTASAPSIGLVGGPIRGVLPGGGEGRRF
jgi:hypothetical protein